MKHKFLRKTVVYVASILLVCGVVGGAIYAKDKIEQAKVEAQYEPPKAVMSQEEMEALYDEHKVDKTVTDGVSGEAEGIEKAEQESIEVTLHLR